MSRVVDWGLAERAAATVIAGLPGLPGGGGQPASGGYSAAEVETRLRRGDRDRRRVRRSWARSPTPPVPELIDRRDWARNALATLAEAAAPLEERLAADLSLPGPLGPIARRGVGAAIGTEAGLAAGYAAKRVLGQYDVALFGPTAPGAAAVRGREHGRGPAQPRRRPRALPALGRPARDHARDPVRARRVARAAHGRAGRRADRGSRRGPRRGCARAIGRRLLRDPRELVRALLRGELARTLADPSGGRCSTACRRRCRWSRATPSTSWTPAPPSSGPSSTELRRRLDQRRARRGGLGELIARLLGMDLKLRQYEPARPSATRSSRRPGRDALRIVWRSPDDLPDLAELEAPDALARAGRRGTRLIKR